MYHWFVQQTLKIWIGDIMTNFLDKSTNEILCLYGGVQQLVEREVHLLWCLSSKRWSNTILEHGSAEEVFPLHGPHTAQWWPSQPHQLWERRWMWACLLHTAPLNSILVWCCHESKCMKVSLYEIDVKIRLDNSFNCLNK